MAQYNDIILAFESEVSSLNFDCTIAMKFTLFEFLVLREGKKKEKINASFERENTFCEMIMRIKFNS